MEITIHKLQITNRVAWTGSQVALVRCLLGVLPLLSAAAPAAPVSFSQDLAPVLADKCVECHREKKAKGRYRLDTFEALLDAGESNEKPVTPGNPDASTIYSRLISPDEDERMPQKGDALPAAQIELFRRWIAEGAKFDGPDPAIRLGDLVRRKEASGAPGKYPRPLPVTALALGEDGSSCYTGGYHELLQWSLGEGKLLRRIPDMPERVLAISLQKGGDSLVVAGGTPGRSGEALIVSRGSGAVAKRLAGAKDTFLTATFNPDGSLLALGGTDNTVRVFRSSDWKQLWKAEVHADWIMGLAFSPDGRHLASASRDRSSRVFEAEKGGIVHAFVEHQSAVLCAAFDSAGETVITGAADGEVRRWTWQETDSGNRDKKGLKKKRQPGSTVLKGRRQEVTALAVSGDRLYTASSDGSLCVYDLPHAGNPVEIDSLRSRASVARVSDSGTRLVYGGLSGEVRALDLATGNTLLLKFKASPGWSP